MVSTFALFHIFSAVSAVTGRSFDISWKDFSWKWCSASMASHIGIGTFFFGILYLRHDQSRVEVEVEVGGVWLVGRLY